ncbi:MAG: acetylxylan esterase [Pirellulales bacterium]|nr:acetylxylan esterase [Pirellulales bacterium]
MTNIAKSTFAVLLLVMAMSSAGFAAPANANYDESKVPSYTLPDLLLTLDGEKVTDAKTWEEKRRPEVLELFRKHMYGRSPGRPQQTSYQLKEISKQVFGGKATRKQITIHLANDQKHVDLDLLIYLPNKVKGPAPIFLGLNFMGNHSIESDPAIFLSKTKWFRNKKDAGYVNNRATEKSRGSSTARWPVEMIIDRGFGLATIYYGDIDPDYHDEFKNGVHGLFESGNQKRPGDAWGTISAWAWGLSRAMDYFETDEDIDQRRVAVFGHSRLGKTALWAGAQDERFAIVISNDSGCGGAALSKRCFGETLARMNRVFPHWNCENCKQYGGNEAALPLDQHMLIALVAPRPIYVASASGDLWADPKGEFLAAKHAQAVYALYGKKGLDVDDMPQLDKSVGHYIGYHIRTGKHNITAFDWRQYLKFAEKHFAK